MGSVSESIVLSNGVPPIVLENVTPLPNEPHPVVVFQLVLLNMVSTVRAR